MDLVICKEARPSRPQKQMTQSNIPLPPVNTGQLFRNPVIPPQVDTKSAPTMRNLV